MIWPWLILGISLWLYHLLTPLDINPVIWNNPDPLPKLDHNWRKNDRLVDALHVNEGSITAPESIVFDPRTGDGYASLSDGRVVSLDIHGVYKEDILFIGEILGYISTNKAIDSSSNLYQWCRSEALSGELAWNCTAESTCGRPLGLRILEIYGHSILYILDAYYGMFEYNISSASVTHLFDSTTLQFVGNHPVSQEHSLKPHFFNDFDIQIFSPQIQSSNTPHIRIYFSDTSYRHHRCQNRQAIMDGAPTGRLYLFDSSSSVKHISLLLSSLHFPNGVQFFSDNRTLLLAESSRFRLISVDTEVLSVYLSNIDKESLKNQSTLLEIPSFQSLIQSPSSGIQIYLSSIPGFIDNIRAIPSSPHLPASLSQHHSPLYTISLGTLSCKPFSLLYLLYQSYWLRVIIARVLPMRYLEHAVPAYGYVAILSEKEGIVETYQDPSGRTPFLSQANFHPITGDLWLGSHSNKYLGIKKWKD